MIAKFSSLEEMDRMRRLATRTVQFPLWCSRCDASFVIAAPENTAPILLIDAAVMIHRNTSVTCSAFDMALLEVGPSNPTPQEAA